MSQTLSNTDPPPGPLSQTPPTMTTFINQEILQILKDQADNRSALRTLQGLLELPQENDCLVSKQDIEDVKLIENTVRFERDYYNLKLREIIDTLAWHIIGLLFVASLAMFCYRKHLEYNYTELEKDPLILLMIILTQVFTSGPAILVMFLKATARHKHQMKMVDKKCQKKWDAIIGENEHDFEETMRISELVEKQKAALDTMLRYVEPNRVATDGLHCYDLFLQILLYHIFLTFIVARIVYSGYCIHDNYDLFEACNAISFTYLLKRRSM